jgi:hypothetical protein
MLLLCVAKRSEGLRRDVEKNLQLAGNVFEPSALQ